MRRGSIADASEIIVKFFSSRNPILRLLGSAAARVPGTESFIIGSFSNAFNYADG
jgi:hypothetical protein